MPNECVVELVFDNPAQPSASAFNNGVKSAPPKCFHLICSNFKYRCGVPPTGSRTSVWKKTLYHENTALGKADISKEKQRAQTRESTQVFLCTTRSFQ